MYFLQNLVHLYIFSDKVDFSIQGILKAHSEDVSCFSRQVECIGKSDVIRT